MIQCNKCGQGNAFESNFCRFCGYRLEKVQQQDFMPPTGNGNGSGYDPAPPRPYMWKTDEFQLKETEGSARQTQQINRVERFADLNKTALQTPPIPNNLQQSPQGQQLARYDQQTNMSFGYRCPRCATQLLPKIVRKISPVGWVVFAVLMVTFFPLFWIGFLIKEDTRVCPICNLKVN